MTGTYTVGPSGYPVCLQILGLPSLHCVGLLHVMSHFLPLSLSMYVYICHRFWFSGEPLGMYVLPATQKYCGVSDSKIADWEMGGGFSSHLLLLTALACHSGPVSITMATQRGPLWAPIHLLHNKSGTHPTMSHGIG